MKTFSIDHEKVIVAHSSERAAATAEQASVFTTEANLERLARDWPAARLVAVWNALPGVSPVKRFTDRATAVRRIWKAIQNLQPAAPTAIPKGTHERSKKVQVLTLLERPEGVSVQEIMAVTAWQAHTVRGFLSGTVGKRMGLRVTSERRADGQRAYRLQAHDTHGEP